MLASSSSSSSRYANRSQHRILNCTLALFLFGHVFFTYCYSIRPTIGISMSPTLNATGDWVLVSRRHRRGRNIGIGDVVNFYHPIKVGEGGIKRVIGMPGDFVLRDTPGKGDGLLLKVPDGHCWVAGDNQANSRDSRLFGPLPLALIKGKVTARVLPLSQMGWIKNTLQSIDVRDGA